MSIPSSMFSSLHEPFPAMLKMEQTKPEALQTTCRHPPTCGKAQRRVCRASMVLLWNRDDWNLMDSLQTPAESCQVSAHCALNYKYNQGLCVPHVLQDRLWLCMDTAFTFCLSSKPCAGGLEAACKAQCNPKVCLHLQHCSPPSLLWCISGVAQEPVATIQPQNVNIWPEALLVHCLRWSHHWGHQDHPAWKPPVRAFTLLPHLGNEGEVDRYTMLQRCPNCTADCGGGFLAQQKHCLQRVRVFQISKIASGKPSLVSHPSPILSPFCKNTRREVA